MALLEESSLSGVNYSDKLLVTKKLKTIHMESVSSNASSSSSINSDEGGNVSPLVRRDMAIEENL